MRPTPQQVAAVRRVSTEVAGQSARVVLFGSGTRDGLSAAALSICWSRCRSRQFRSPAGASGLAERPARMLAAQDGQAEVAAVVAGRKRVGLVNAPASAT